MIGPNSLVLRADATSTVGTGHVMRLLAVAQAWIHRGGDVTLATRIIADRVRDRVESEGVHVVAVDDDDGFIRAISSSPPAWVAFDGYCLDSALHGRARAAGARVLVVDDFGRVGRYEADVILDQNAGASARDYHDRHPTSFLLIGPRFALLRREFWGARPTQQTSAQVNHVVVTMGGLPGDKHVIAAEAAVGRCGVTATVSFLHRTPTVDMPTLLKDADMALSAGGTTSYELCYMGVPSVLVAIADNQVRVVDSLAALGAALRAPSDVDSMATALRALASDQSLRCQVAQAASALVDDKGARRLVSILRSYRINLRDVTPADAALLFQWRNDPLVRAMSFTSTKIAWSSHLHWLEQRIADRDTKMFIGADELGEIGQFRAQREDRRGEVSVSVAGARRGQGAAAELIAAGTRAVISSGYVDACDAFIKPDNVASAAAFSLAGYGLVEIDPVRGGALHYAFEDPFRHAART